ncbi:hypothetical protein ILUMI_01324 [Ignelater luminosus]|uniref:Peroxisome assembly protein 12 n=1 Tax=Ignelater luminosus TaxID=2038154 RepID=A0A8K0DEV4_IGNLU|nr:hypothetical protein ILUMI_01324 [Ignelater luminosus]
MAESAAHFTATLEAKPSIFEVIAQSSLNSTLHPALQKVAMVLASINPKRFNWLSEYYEEVFFVLNGIIQHHYLRTKNASFSEYFYGLQRISCNSDTKLSDYHKKVSLVFLIVLPYLKRKLEEKIQIYRIENAEGSIQTNVKGVCKRAILVSHSFFEIFLNSWTLIQYLRYMSDQSEFQLPFLQILKLKLVYSNELQDDSGFWSALFRGQLSFSELSKGFIQNTALSFLELSAFFIQFLQVWNQERPNYNFSALPVVPPPPPDNKAENYKGRCPICLQNWKIPTVLPVSGYVFCFPCIIRHLREHQCCPVTNLPAKPLDVIRLYDNAE